MTEAHFTKTYLDADRCNAAHRHLLWLQGLASGVRLPAVTACREDCLTLEYLNGSPAGVGDLPAIAVAIGRLHATGHVHHLHAARLDEPFVAELGLTITDFVTPRLQALQRAGVWVDRLPAAFYKDSNIRNFLLTEDGVAVVDFDDLTLAPFGYDLAKLVVSATMTYGQLPDTLVAASLEAYNAATTPAGPAAVCTRNQLDTYAELHHLLTERYLGRNGYRFTWSAPALASEGPS